MSVEELVGAIKAADIGPFREVRLVTLVHQTGPTKETVAQVIKEIKEVTAEEKLELQGLRTFLDTVAGEIETVKELNELLKKVSKAAH